MWKDHVVDMYLLMEDIVNNHHLQIQGYKSGFYYVFNPRIAYREAEGDFHSQLKLLAQLKARGAISYTVKDIPPGIPEEFLSKNVGQFGDGPTLYIKIIPLTFHKVFQELAKSYEGVLTEDESEGPITFSSTSGMLSIGSLMVAFQLYKNNYNLLNELFRNKQTRKREWSHQELWDRITNNDQTRVPADFMRHTVNNINKHVASKTKIKKLIIVTKLSVQLDGRFV